MASGASDYLENEFIKHVFRTGSFTKPTSLWIALFTATPSDSGGGTEVTATGYARVALNPLDANWAATSGTSGATSNLSTISYGTWTTGPTTVVGFAIFDASTSGNMLVWGDLAISKTISANDAFSLPAGNLTCSIA